MDFFDDLNGYASAAEQDLNYEHYLYRTNDGGASWQLVGSLGKLEYWTYYMTASNVAVAQRFNQQTLSKTTDDGTSWLQLNPPFIGFPYIHFTDAQTGYLFGEVPPNEEMFDLSVDQWRS